LYDIRDKKNSFCLQIIAEAHRLLSPSGQLWMTEMDLETEGYVKLRANVALYSLIRATGAHAYRSYISIYPSRI